MNFEDIKHGLPVKEIKDLNGQIYFVGGIVRDFYCDKISKDIDVVITNIEFHKLITLLKKSGKVNLVGESFGIIKYKAPDCDEVDVALPRTERKIDSGYQGFEVYSDPFLSIESDLFRRDFTINAIAISIDGEVIDPFNGIDDIKKCTIRMVNPTTFNEDPLRMLRAIQFAIRFNFKIDDLTFNAICDNNYKINEISVERWLIELDKVFYKVSYKSKIVYLIELLLKTGLYNYMFGNPILSFNKFGIPYNMTRADFYYQIIRLSLKKTSYFFKQNLNGDISTYKTIYAIDCMYEALDGIFISDYHLINKLYKISNDIINTNEFKKNLGVIFKKMKDENLPISLKELNITGDDIIELTGKTGTIIGVVLNDILDKIYSGSLTNSKTLIVEYIKKIYE